MKFTIFIFIDTFCGGGGVERVIKQSEALTIWGQILISTISHYKLKYSIRIKTTGTSACISTNVLLLC